MSKATQITMIQLIKHIGEPMSQTFSIACTQCKKHLWIAQASYMDKFDGHLYGTKEYSKALFHFLMEHKGHPLIFDENCESDIIEFEEIEIEE